MVAQLWCVVDSQDGTVSLVEAQMLTHVLDEWVRMTREGEPLRSGPFPVEKVHEMPPSTPTDDGAQLTERGRQKKRVRE